MNKRTLGIINRITEGRYTLSDFKGDKLKKTESPVSHSTISKNDDVVIITKRHKPAVHTHYTIKTTYTKQLELYGT